MIKSKKLQKFKNINHGFFNSIGGISSGIYKSLNCGIGSNDNKKNVTKNKGQIIIVLLALLISLQLFK